MTQTSTWAAILAPVGEVGLDNRIIDSACVITVSNGALLLTHDGMGSGAVG
jgi:hypothetical protein